MTRAGAGYLDRSLAPPALSSQSLPMHRLSVLASACALACSLACSLASCKKGGGEDVEELTQRIEKLEAEAEKFQKIEEFIRPIMKQQEAEAERRAAQEPDPNARFAVNIEGNPALGPSGAAVTVIEAFDFA